MLQIFRFVPLMGVVLLLYNALSLGYSDPGMGFWQHPMLQATLPSGQLIVFSYGVVMITGALFILFIELLKSTSASNAAMVEQTLSTLAFTAFLVQFFVSPHVAEPTFFILLVISLVEVLAGFAILVKVARRDFSVG